MLTVRKKIGRVTPSQYKATEDIRFNIPHGKGGDVIVALFLRVHGTMTVGVADASSLQTRGMERVLRHVRLFAEHEDLQIEGALRAYTSAGVNDAVGGRTKSYAGVMLAFEGLADVGTPIPQTDPGLTVGAQTVDITFPIRFRNPHAKNPWATCLDTRRLRNLYLEVGQGILDTTAAGDDTDVLVTAATTTVVSALNFDLGAVVLKRVPAGLKFDIRKTRSLSTNLSENTELPQDLGNNSIYRRLLLICTDDDVLSDARITDLSVRIDDAEDIAWGRWKEFRGEAKGDYGIATLPAGMNVITFPSGLDARSVNACALRLNVASGAVLADDRLMILSEELLRMPKVASGVVGVAGARRRR